MSELNEALAAVRARPPRWIDVDTLPVLRDRDGVALSDTARSRLVAALKSEGPRAPSPVVAAAQAQLQPADCAALVRALHAAWEQAGQPTRDRTWLLCSIGLLGDDDAIDALGHGVREAVRAKRHKAAGVCIEALARGRGHTSRRWLAQLTRDAPSLTLRAAAWSARCPVDDAHHWSVPVSPHHYGFSVRAVRDYDHGGRVLTLQLTEDGSILMSDGDRSLKTLPAARKKDDPEAVQRSRQRFQLLKAHIQASLHGLTAALEEAMVLAHPLADWDHLQRNPLAWRASRGLIFEVRPSETAVCRFFLSDEGDPLGMHGEDVDLPDGPVRIAHPLRMDDAERGGWEAILRDACATPPFEQLQRPCRRPAAGPAPLAAVLAVLPPMAVPRLRRGLKGLGFLPDTLENANVIRRAMRFCGPYLIVAEHDPYAANPFRQSPQRPIRLTGVRVLRGKQVIPSEALPLRLFSELASGFGAL